MKWDLVIFDCDGVLVDSEPIAIEILSEMIAELGLPMSQEQAAMLFVGRSDAECLRIIERRLGGPAPQGFFERHEARMFEAFRRELRPVPGISDALDRISVPVCVASSGDYAKMRTTLGLTGLLPRFEGRLFSATDVAQGKPAPDIFLHAAREMGASPGDCAVVEDAVVGVQAAVAAGMTVFGYAGRTDSQALASAGAHLFREMRDLPGLLDMVASHKR